MKVVHIESETKEGLKSQSTIMDYYEGIYEAVRKIMDNGYVKISVEKYDTDSKEEMTKIKKGN